MPDRFLADMRAAATEQARIDEHMGRMHTDRQAILRAAAATERMVLLLEEIIVRLGRLEALAERGPMDPSSLLSPAKRT
jgi:hypothetical protein